jgi:asparagine synthase (glutamine-hydrolysing)
MSSLGNHHKESVFIDKLKTSLLESFQKLCEIQRCGVLFSGGVDSSLAALLTERFCDEVTLFSSCSEDSRDSMFVSQAADALNLQIIETRMTSECIWDTLPEVIHAIGRSQRMDVEIALPFFLSSKEANKNGIHDIVSGQGPDELFAGYARHVEVYKEQGERALQDLLRQEVSKTHVVNIKRDKKVITYNGGAAYFPYLDTQFVEIALSIPVALKVVPDESPSRKVIFRKLAMNMGLPAELATKPKDATQYSSGSSKVLIDSVRDHVFNYQPMSRKKASILVQDILNLIASEIGLPIDQPLNRELEIDLKPTRDLVNRLDSTNHQQ